MSSEGTTEKARNIWDRCLAFIRDNIEEMPYHTWFEPIVPLSYNEREKMLYLQAQSNFVFEFLDEHYKGILKAALEKVTGNSTCRLRYKSIVDSQKGTGIKYRTEPKLAVNASTQPTQNTVPAAPKAATAAAKQEKLPALDSHLFPKFSFDSFILDESNLVARNIASAIASDPSKPYNPFFLWGDSGVGKTHLINAIGLFAKQQNPEKRVLYISANLFKVQYTDSVKRNCRNDFIRFYQTIDLLLIDDVQEWAGLQGTASTQNAFFQIFNHLSLTGRQVVFTADRSPVELQGFDDRILTRLRSGAQIGIDRPTIELRRAILHRKVKQEGLTIPHDVVEYLARNINTSVREFDGILCSLIAHSVSLCKPITLPLAKSILDKIYVVPECYISINDIVREVARVYEISAEELTSRSRKQNIVMARQIAMYLARKHTDKSNAAIGKEIGGRDHSTVIYATKVVEEQREVSRLLRNNLQKMEKRLRST